jgi:hypothetical protein
VIDEPGRAEMPADQFQRTVQILDEHGQPCLAKPVGGHAEAELNAGHRASCGVTECERT